MVIKPNWVFHHNYREPHLDALVTHSSLIKYIIDMLAIAMEGQGSIVIGDAPLQSCVFAELLKRTRISDVVAMLQAEHPGIEILVEDWRLTVLDNQSAAQTRRDADEAVTQHYRLVDLGTTSFLEDLSDYSDGFRVTCYPHALMAAHHQRGKHEYLVTKRVFAADLVINLPKVKTHIKAGMTGALKNLVGINGHKEFLPHHMRGASEAGGDGYYKRHALREWYACGVRSLLGRLRRSHVAEAACGRAVARRAVARIAGGHL